MLDKLKNKKKGDPFPGAAHVNALNEAARRVLQSPNYSARDYPPWQQRLMRIVSIDYPLGQALYLKRVYEIRPMFYSENDDERDLSSDSSNEVDIADDWEVDDESNAQFLDASLLESDLALNDIIAVYFDTQRGMWVPATVGAVAAVSGSSVAKNAIWGVVILGQPGGGTFTLIYGAEETGDIAYNAAISVVLAELEGLSTIGSGNVTVYGTGATSFAVEFIGDLEKQASAVLTINATELLGHGVGAATYIIQAGG